MKSMNKFFAICLGAILVLSSCETAELDLTTNPNALDPAQADADFFLNAIQEDFAGWSHTIGNIGSDLTRITYLYGRVYAQAYDPGDFNGTWSDAYQVMLEDIRLLNILAESRPYALGMGEVMEAYIYLTLVDYFGDVPQADALKGGDGVLNPLKTAGVDVYAHAIGKLDAAIANFTTGGGAPANDFFYKGDATKWIKAANSLKMQAYWNTEDITAYNAIKVSGNYISTPADDFQFQWGTSPNQPDTRHPDYRNSYRPTGGSAYMSNWMMNTMLQGAKPEAEEQGIPDPRLLYYYYRQVESTPGFDLSEANEEVLECGVPGYFNPYGEGNLFCSPGRGYWGRDHGNDNGTPPDTFFRTLHGVYPAGGKYDDRTFKSQVNGAGAGGAGITPIMLSSWMHFMNAYVAGVGSAEAQTETEAGISDSLDKVSGFAGSAPMDATTVTNYKDAFVSAWTRPGVTDAEKANLWAKQYWISLMGNGSNAYNSYRKTGLPTDLQPNIEPNPGAFPLSMWYPNNFVTRNQSTDQKANLVQAVFWNTSTPSLK